MKTKFDGIVVHIDDEQYEVSYSFATPSQKEELGLLTKVDDEAIENYSKLSSRLETLENKKVTNSELIPLLAGAEKLEVLQEQRAILSELEKLEPKVKKAAQVQMSEEASLKRYEYLVGGKDKERLKEDALKHNIPVSVVMREVVEALAKAKEKK